MKSNNLRVVLRGPPHSGKSCLRYGLKQALRKLSGVYPYVITACPDGEGAWFHETVERDQELAEECKKRYKGKFSPEFVERVARSVEDCSLPLVMVDIGGFADEKNEKICRSATHAILLAPKARDFTVWREFCGKLGLRIIAEVISEYNASADEIGRNESGMIVGSVHYLERGSDVDRRPMVVELAKELLVIHNCEAGS